MPTQIKTIDFVQSISDAFQYISVYHPPNFIKAMTEAYQREKSDAARDAMAQILTNSRLCAQGIRPICQDTGICVVFLKIGMQVRFEEGADIQAMVDEGVRRAYQDTHNPLRASVLYDPAGQRKNSRDNTPAVVHVELVPGDTVEVICAAKGGGSENKAKFKMLNPSDSIIDWVLETVPTMGAGWCPPGVLGIGIGGTPEKAMLMAKEALMEPIDISELKRRGAQTTAERLRLELVEKINALGIGAQGLGGVTTVLDVKVKDHPTHAASLPVAMIPNCAATRHIHFTLKPGKGAISLSAPSMNLWPDVSWKADPTQARAVNLENLTKEEVAQWKPGEVLLLSGTLLTGRDAAHRRIQTLLESGQPLPIDFTGRLIYYVGPVDPVRDEAVGPAGPTTATRMDKFTDIMLKKTGLLGMIGKAERSQATTDKIALYRSAYMIAVGGAAYLVSKAIRSAKVVAFEDLGMEAIYEFEVQDMPVTVAVDSLGQSVHQTGPQTWKRLIQKAHS